MPTTIEDAIDAAQKAAAATPAAAAGALAPTTAGGALASPASRGAPLGLDDMMGGTISVDSWLKVNEFGLFVGTDKTPHDAIEVDLDMSEIAYCYQIRYGNPAQYEKTFDRVTNSKGGSWTDAVRRAQTIDPKASEYRSADIPFTLVEDVKAKDGKTVVLEAGKTIGHSLSVTGWKSFQTFIKALTNKGYDPYSAKVRLSLSYEAQKNSKGEWGILIFGEPTLVS